MISRETAIRLAGDEHGRSRFQSLLDGRMFPIGNIDAAWLLAQIYGGKPSEIWKKIQNISEEEFNRRRAEAMRKVDKDIKPSCLKCGYLIGGPHRYKCYTKNCPAKQRDDREKDAQRKRSKRKK